MIFPIRILDEDSVTQWKFILLVDHESGRVLVGLVGPVLVTTATTSNKSEITVTKNVFLSKHHDIANLSDPKWTIKYFTGSKDALRLHKEKYVYLL